MNAPIIHILVVEDEIAHTELICRAFDAHANRFQLTIARTLEESQTCLAKETPDLVITDWRLPDGAGTSLLPGKDGTQGFPVLVMTSHGDEQTAVEAMKAGALDYIVKSPETLADMRHIVERALREWGYIVERQRAENVQSVLFHISQAASTTDDLEELVAAIHQQLGTLIPATNFYVALYDKKQGLYSFPYAVNERDTDSHPRMLYGSLTDFVRRTGKPLLLDADGDLQLMEEGEVEMVGAPMVSWLGVPLKTAQRVFGVVVVQSYTEDVLYTNRDLELLVIVADNIASLIERKQAEETLRESEARYRSLFEDSPISLWEEDFSAIKAYVDDLRASGVTDFRAYFESNPEAVAHCARLVKVLNVNQATVELFGAQNKDDFYGEVGLDLIFDKESLATFPEELIALAEGIIRFEGEVAQQTLAGDNMHAVVSFSVAPGYEDTWSKVFASIIDITKRKQVEKALQEERDKVQQYLNIAEVILVALNPQGAITMINRKGCQVLGYTEEELLNQNWFDTCLPESIRQEMQSFFQQVITGKTEPVIHFENPVLTRSGETRLSAWNNAWLLDDSGQIIGSLSSGEDITERKQVEDALRKSEATLQGVFRAAPVGIGLVKDRVFQWVNEGFQHMVGYSGMELLDQNTRLVYPDDEEYEYVGRDKYGQLYNQGIGTVETRLQHKEGPIIDVVMSSSYLDPTNPAAGAIFTALDISERKRLEAELQRYTESLEDLVEERTRGFEQARKRVEAILNNTTDAIALARTDGTIEQTNKAFDELFGYRDDEAFGLHLVTFVQPADADQVSLAVQAVVKDEQSQRFEVIAWRQDKTTFDGDAVIAPVREHDNNLSGMVFSLRDITHFKEVERVKTRFIANAAHDLGNPITNLKLRLYSLRRSPEQLREHMTILESETRRLEYLVNDLRTLSQLDHGTLVLGSSSTSFDLNELVADVIEAHRLMAEDKAQTLVFESDSSLTLIRADRRMYERVVVNLVSNALNYTPDGGTITVITQSAPDFAILKVRDTGIGISPEDLPYIFERFYRSDEAQNTGVEGTGLGLSIVQEIVEAYGGQIQVEGLPGQGTTFTVLLPTVAQ